MELVVTSAGMQDLDRYAIRRYGIPSALLMENAGRQVATTAFELMRRSGGDAVTIICGIGKNGGDGLVAARHLLEMGALVRVVLLGRPARLTGDPRMNFTVLDRLRKEAHTRERLELVSDPAARTMSPNNRAAVVIDAIFGTGFHGKLSGGPLRAIEWINHQPSPVVSVDIPSGLNADNGSVGNSCVNAAVTVTMGAIKAGLLVGQGPEVCGRIIVAGLGVPTPSPSLAGGGIRRITSADVARALPVRPFNAHKHSVGKILILAGSVGYTGAAALAASASMKTGAGGVVLAVPSSVYPIMARKLTEVIVKPVPESMEGTFCEDSLDPLTRELGWADMLIVGPGMGRSPAAVGFLKKLLKMTGKRFLLDADALTLIAENNPLLGILRKNRCILTPHSGEFARLTGLSVSQIEGDRIESARNFAKSRKVHLILKGAPTVVADPDGKVYINQTGNQGMASAGMGDLLAGIIAAIWAETGDMTSSSYAGVFLHGEAGDQAAARLGVRGMTARDVLSQIPYVLKNYSDNGKR